MLHREHAAVNRTVAHTHAAAPVATRLGERLRELRVAAGMTQTELAGDRFSKEYVSQIERGKTRPTPRDGRVARGAPRRRRRLPRERRLERRARPRRGGARPRRGARPSGRLRRGDRRVRRGAGPVGRGRRAGARGAAPRRRGLGADAQRRGARRRSTCSPRARARRGAELLGRRPRRGALPARRRPLHALEHRDRVALFDEALELADRSELRADHLRSNILTWRSRCYRRQRDYEAAREDVERALELAEAMNDRRTTARRLLPGVAHRRARRALGARAHVRGAREASYEEARDRATSAGC